MASDAKNGGECMGYRTVKHDACFEFTEKKSRFIGRAFYTPTEEAAKAAIAAVRAGDPEARHHVFAYVIHDGNITRFSDDGEPAGTGGAPTLNAITRGEKSDVTVVVTRYFGGILLGAGGLTRAYAKAAAGALDAAETTETVPFSRFEIRCPYPKLGTVQYLLQKRGVEILSRDFSAGVVLEARAETPIFDAVCAAFGEDPSVCVSETERTSARRL